MTGKKTSVTLYLRRDQHSSLKALSAVTRVPVSEFIRQGIDLVLKHEGSPASPVQLELKLSGG